MAAVAAALGNFARAERLWRVTQQIESDRGTPLPLLERARYAALLDKRGAAVEAATDATDETLNDAIEYALHPDR